MKKDILIVEPFNGGSHGQLIKLLQSDEKIGPRSEVICLPARKWQWRARTAALYLSQIIPASDDYRLLFTSSVLNLAELVALRPDLASLKKIVYFHENQLVYPVRERQDRDFQFGYNQILTSMVADMNIFNSEFNMKSFLSSIDSHIKLIPNHRPKNLPSTIHPKCKVLYFPIKLDENEAGQNSASTADAHTVAHVSDKYAEDRNGNTVRKKCDEDNYVTDVNEKSKYTKECDDIAHKSLKSEMCSDTQQPGHKLTEMESELQRITELHCLSGDSEEFNLDKGSEEVAVGESQDVTAEEDLDVTFKPCMEINGSGDGLMVNAAKQDRTQKLKATTSTSRYSDSKAHQLRPGSPNPTDVIRPTFTENGRSQTCLHIVWPHRWEHDKDPDFFLRALLQLQSEGYDFRVSVIGQTFKDVPEIFHTARAQLAGKIVSWGYQKRQDYQHILNSAHVVVSTALHEFFGVSMLEATTSGCYPLCPSRLVYPEIYPKECLYTTQSQLLKRLRHFCRHPQKVPVNRYKDLADRYSWKHLQEHYRRLLLER